MQTFLKSTPFKLGAITVVLFGSFCAALIGRTVANYVKPVAATPLVVPIQPAVNEPEVKPESKPEPTSFDAFLLAKENVDNLNALANAAKNNPLAFNEAKQKRNEAFAKMKKDWTGVRVEGKTTVSAPYSGIHLFWTEEIKPGKLELSPKERDADSVHKVAIRVQGGVLLFLVDGHDKATLAKILPTRTTEIYFSGVVWAYPSYRGQRNVAQPGSYTGWHIGEGTITLTKPN